VADEEAVWVIDPRIGDSVPLAAVTGASMVAASVPAAVDLLRSAWRVVQARTLLAEESGAARFIPAAEAPRLRLVIAEAPAILADPVHGQEAGALMEDIGRAGSRAAVRIQSVTGESPRRPGNAAANRGA
jgi:hypothetical protein